MRFFTAAIIPRLLAFPIKEYNPVVSVYSVFAAELAGSAGGLARRRFYAANHRVKRKNGGEPVTDADREVEQFVIDKLAQKFPAHGVLGEETGATGDQKQCWVIDPIDGTTNYIHQYPQCAVSVAFCQHGRAVAGAVHDIAANETFVAAAGEGAYLHNRRLRVAADSRFAESLFVASGSMSEKTWPLIRHLASSTAGMRRGGSTALDLAHAAAGRADMVVSGPVRFWDVAAGALILREAGGLLADISDRTGFEFDQPTECFIAGAPHLFSAYRRAFKTHLS